MGESQLPGADSSSTPTGCAARSQSLPPPALVNWDVAQAQLSSRPVRVHPAAGGHVGGWELLFWSYHPLSNARLCVLGQVTQPPWTQPLTCECR